MNAPHDSSRLADSYPILIAAITVFREAGGEPFAGKVAVARVIRNRTRPEFRTWPDTLEGVCLQKAQFSCWNPGDATSSRLPIRGTPDWACFLDCLRAVEESEILDPSDGATHYYNPKLADPPWAKRLRLLCEIGHHRFLK